MSSSVASLKDFARRLKAHLPGILAHCTYKLHTSVLEGVTLCANMIETVSSQELV
jgi:hypothetical protein